MLEAAGASADGADARRLGPAACRVAPLGAPGFVAEFAQRTCPGTGREFNEDAIGGWPTDGGFLFAVADGLGGYDGGEVASRLALDTLEEAMRTAPAAWPPERRLRRGFELANLAVHERGRMRTTLTASLLEHGVLTTGHVGDCRMLVFRDGVLRQRTADHNVAGRLAELRLVSVRGLVRHPARRVLTRCLGNDAFVRVEVTSTEARPGDIYLQCSDGIAWVSGPDIIDVIVRHDPETAARILVRRVVDAGGDDDTSVQVVSVLSCRPGRPRPSWLGGWLNRLGAR